MNFRTHEAFVYCWTDHKTGMIYVGSHKGTLCDGYVCSSKLMLEEYKKRPDDFTRQIVAEGTYQDIRKLEELILVSANAKMNEQFYNQSNGDADFYVRKHTEESKRKVSNSLRGKKKSEESRQRMRLAKIGNKSRLGNPLSEETKEKIRLMKVGKKLSEETKRKMSESHKRRHLEKQ